MAENRELSLDEIAELSTPTKKESSYTVPGTATRKKYDPEIRTVTNWFKLPLTLQGECEVPLHDEERQSRSAPRMYFVHPNTSVKMCRWCFIEQRDKIG